MQESLRDEVIKFSFTEPAKEGAREKLRFTALAELIFVGFIAAVVEIILFTVLSKKLGNVFFVVVTHIGLVVLLALWVRWRQRHHSGVRIAILLTVSTAFLGAFGAVGTFISVFVYYLFQRTSRSFMEWYKDIFPDDDNVGTALHELHLNLISGRENPEIAISVTSFNDVLKRGSVQDKLAAIQVISRNFQPHFAPALKLGIQDSDPMIRVQAASAIAALERKFSNNQQKLEKEHAKKSSFKSLIALAVHHDNYGNLGILDADRAIENRKKALEYYKEAYDQNPDDDEINFAIGRLYVKLNQHQDAVDWYKNLISKQKVTPEIIGWMIESLFKLKAYDELRRFIVEYEKVIDIEKLHDNVKGFIELWRNRAKAIEGGAS